MKRINKFASYFFLVPVLWLFASHAALAQLLDDIEIRPSNGDAEIRIKFTMPVRYLRHFPLEKGELVNIYFQIVSVDGVDEPLREEHRKSPPSKLVPPFTVTFTSFGATNIVRDPMYVAIQFSKAVSYKVQQKDNNSFILTVPVTAVPGETAPATESPKK